MTSFYVSRIFVDVMLGECLNYAAKELLLQSGMLQQQTECIAIIYKHLRVLMTPAHLYWLLGQIRTVVDPGQGHNNSMRALLRRTTSSELEGHSNKPNV